MVFYPEAASINCTIIFKSNVFCCVTGHLNLLNDNAIEYLKILLNIISHDNLL